MEQNQFLALTDANVYADNPEPRCPCLLLLDVSASMEGEPIKQLAHGVDVYRDSLFSDELARKRVEVAIMTFGGTVDLKHPFVTVDALSALHFRAQGGTPMARAVVEGLKYLETQKGIYRANGIAYYRPWVFLITDGGPNDPETGLWGEAVRQVREGEQRKAFSFFSVGVEGANFEKLTELSVRQPLKLQRLEFQTLFTWLSASQQAVSRSRPGEAVPLLSPAGWAEV
ncbi:MAG TPA: VWA domain-containing protein [Chthoniobacterales bacterium]